MTAADLKPGRTYETTRGTFTIHAIGPWRGGPHSVYVTRPNGAYAVYAVSDVLTWAPRLQSVARASLD